MSHQFQVRPVAHARASRCIAAQSGANDIKSQGHRLVHAGRGVAVGHRQPSGGVHPRHQVRQGDLSRAWAFGGIHRHHLASQFNQRLDFGHRRRDEDLRIRISPLQQTHTRQSGRRPNRRNRLHPFQPQEPHPLALVLAGGLHQKVHRCGHAGGGLHTRHQRALSQQSRKRSEGHASTSGKLSFGVVLPAARSSHARRHALAMSSTSRLNPPSWVALLCRKMYAGCRVAMVARA